MENNDSFSHADIDFCAEFFRRAFPEPQSKNFHTQLGVHFEEIAEMVEALDSPVSSVRDKLQELSLALVSVSGLLKRGDNLIAIKDRVEFLDGLCDQLVTSTGVAHMAGMDITSGFGEVNRSNFSKFDDNGQPILDSNLKMIKGPSYFKPNLKPFAGESH